MLNRLFLILIVFFLPEYLYAWTVTATFEDGVSGTQVEGATGFSNSGTYSTFSNDRAQTGSQSAKFEHQIGTDDWGECHGVLGYTSVAEGGEIWARAYYYLVTPWDWESNPVVKVLRLATYNSGGEGAGWLSIFAYHTGVITLSNEPRDVQTNSSTQFLTNQWQCLEIYVKLHATPGSGAFRIWQNGILILEDTTHATLETSSDYSNIAYFWSYWNGGVPQNQTSYIDTITITNETPENRDAANNPMIGPTDWSETSATVHGGITFSGCAFH